MSNNVKVTCNDCYFRGAGLCALRLPIRRARSPLSRRSDVGPNSKMLSWAPGWRQWQRLLPGRAQPANFLQIFSSGWRFIVPSHRRYTLLWLRPLSCLLPNHIAGQDRRTGPHFCRARVWGLVRQAAWGSFEQGRRSSPFASSAKDAPALCAGALRLATTLLITRLRLSRAGFRSGRSHFWAPFAHRLPDIFQRWLVPPRGIPQKKRRGSLRRSSAEWIFTSLEVISPKTIFVLNPKNSCISSQYGLPCFLPRSTWVSLGEINRQKYSLCVPTSGVLISRRRPT